MGLDTSSSQRRPMAATMAVWVLVGIAVVSGGCRSSKGVTSPPVVLGAGQAPAGVPPGGIEAVSQESNLPEILSGEPREAAHGEREAGTDGIVGLASDTTEAVLPLPAPALADADTEALNEEPLDLDRLVDDVLRINPSVDAMVAAWRSATTQFPQVSTLDDSMFGVALGPGSWGSRSVDSAYMVMASQKLPWPGKLELKGAVAMAEAQATSREIEGMRLELAEMARLSYIEYWLAVRERELNVENIREVRQLQETAEAKLRANLVTQQDVLQAEVEVTLLERRTLELARQERVAIARINTLLHRDPSHGLPRPPRKLRDMPETPVAESLISIALAQRPDLAAVADRMAADRAKIALAHKEFYPDFDAYAKYDAFWQEDPLRPMVGVNFNVPTNQPRRHAAVREVQEDLHRHRAEYARLTDEIANQVQALVEHLVEAVETVELYDTRIIPVAERNVASAEAGYVTGSIDFLRLIEAERQLIELREQRVRAEANLLGRHTEIQRAAAMTGN